MDDADRAAENDFNEEALKNYAARPLVTVKRGNCLNCHAVVPIGLYCDADCRSESEERDKLLRRTR